MEWAIIAIVAAVALFLRQEGVKVGKKAEQRKTATVVEEVRKEVADAKRDRRLADPVAERINGILERFAARKD